MGRFSTNFIMHEILFFLNWVLSDYARKQTIMAWMYTEINIGKTKIPQFVLKFS